MSSLIRQTYIYVLYFRVPSKTRRKHIRFLSKIKFCKNVSHLLKTFKIKSQRDVSTSKRHAATHHLLTKQLSMWCLHDPKMPQHIIYWQLYMWSTLRQGEKKTRPFRGHVPSPKLWLISSPAPLALIWYKKIYFFLSFLYILLEPVQRVTKQKNGFNKKGFSVHTEYFKPFFTSSLI